MKKIKFTFLFLSIAIFACSNGLAQEKPADATQALREQVRQVEMVEVDRKSSVIQDLHKRTLLSVRKQLISSLEDDLKALRTMEAAVGNSDVETRKSIEAQIGSLTQERNDLTTKIKAGGDSAAVRDAFDEGRSNGPTSVSIVAAEPRSSGPDSSSSVIETTPKATRAAITGAATTPPQVVDVKNCKLTNTYKDAPQVLAQRIEQAAKAIRQDTSPDPRDRLAGFTGVYPYMMFFTVADAVVPDGIDKAPANNIRTVERLQYLGETGRTDKQVGASARSAGSTSAIEKPGFARLLGFAVESGAILQDVNNSTVTLSTSPYVLYTMNGGDTVENYNRAGFLNRVGISASFNMTDTNNPLANVRRGDLTEWSIKARLFGDRSTRSKTFQDYWNNKVRPFVEAKGRALGQPIDFIDNSPVLRPLRNQTEAQLDAALLTLLNDADYKAASDAQKEVMLQNVIYCFMRSAIFDQIRTNAIDIGVEARTKINDEYVPRVAQAFANMTQAKKLLREGLDELSKSPLATFAYSNHRQPAASDYSEFKFLYEQDKSVFGILKVVGNAGLTMYNKPNPLLRQTRIRDYSAALSLEGSVDSPFLKNQPDLGKITYAFTGNYQRMRENAGAAGRKADLAAFQFKLDVPIYAGFALPIAVTYSNGTEHTKKEDTRFNFGLKFDADKLFALGKLLGKQ